MAVKNRFLFVVLTLIFLFLILILPFASSQRSPPHLRATPVSANDPITGAPYAQSMQGALFYPPSPQVHQLLNPFSPPAVFPPPAPSAKFGTAILPIATQPGMQEYGQVGILTPTNGGATSAVNVLILPLMGRMSNTRRGRWQYYTLANGVGNFPNKLPVSVKNKQCSSDGCDELFTGDLVYVKGYDQEFSATIYDKQGLQYIPYGGG